MKITRVTTSLLAAGMLLAGVTACGSAGAGHSMSAKSAAYEAAADDTAAYDGGAALPAGAAEMMETEAAYDSVAAAAEETAGQEGASAAEVPENAVSERKLIKTVYLSAETETFDALIPELQGQVEALGGYIESISVYDMDSYYVENRLEKQQGADITARVPKERLDGFLSGVAERTNVTSRSENVEDVTLQYVDLESHKKALLTEQERLLELMEEAESVEDIIAIEGRLSEVRYQLESMESRLRTYDNRIEYSTVYLSLREVRKYSPSEDASVGQRIADGFMKSLEDIGYGIGDLAIGFVIDIPYIVLWIVIIAAAVLVLRVLLKVWKKRAARREASGEKGREKDKVQFRWPVTIKRGQEKTENSRTEDENNDK